MEQLRLQAAELAIGADLAAGRHREVVGELEALVAEEPLREQLHALRMLALYRSGRQSEALQAYREVRELLVDQIGVEPGPELRRLHAAILRQDSELEPPAAELSRLPPELDPRSPLVGREGDLERLRDHWRKAHGGAGRVVLVSGAGGIGKTRLVAELAGEVHAGGAAVVYVGGAAPDSQAALGRARRATAPALVAFDDLDRAPAEIVSGVAGVAADAHERSLLVVVAYREGPGPAAVGRLARELEGQGAELLALGPLEADAVREIAELYAGRRAAPVERLLMASGGMPGRIHELVADWATRDTVERVGARAGRTAARRGELRVLESELVSDVVDLHVVREKAARYSAAPRRDEPGGSDEGGVPVCPFKGLAGFELSDADYFFGRERLVAEMVARLAGANLLGVVGPSGSGKSSAVRAGLLPALASGALPGGEGWKRVLLRPGEHPLANLRRALGANGTRTQSRPRSRASSRRSAVAGNRPVRGDVHGLPRRAGACRVHGCPGGRGAASRLPVAIVLALRADYYGACADHPRLSPLLGDSTVLVGPMQPTSSRRPSRARRARRIWSSSPSSSPGSSKTWLGRRVGFRSSRPPCSSCGGSARVAHAPRAYERTGGVRGAVARLAEQAYGR